MTPTPRMVEAVRKLDRWFPPRGACAFCGHPDARHRQWDAMIANARAGDTAAEIARWYRAPVAAVRAVLRIRPYTRGRRAA